MSDPSLPVPALAHFVWTGPGFSLGHRLAVESLLLTNPELAVTVHLIGDAPTLSPDLERLRQRPGVTVRVRTAHQILSACDDGDQLWRTFQRIPAAAASAQSNLLRYAILWCEGGIYLDLDILVLRSLRPLRATACTLGVELVWRADQARVAGVLAPWMIPPSLAFGATLTLRRAELLVGVRRPPRWHAWLEPRWSQAQPNNAVIASAPRSAFVAALLARAPHVDATVRFRLGPTLVSEVARQRPGEVTLLPPERLYFVPPSQSFRFFIEPGLTPPPQALLLHYVSSNHRRELAAIARGGLRALPASLFRRLASEVEAGRAPTP
jgi:hypothetical protein